MNQKSTYKKEEFFSEIEKYFGPFFEKHKINKIVEKEENIGFIGYYKNETTGLKIYFEFREFYLFVDVFKLKNGEIIENFDDINKNTIIYGFPLEAIVRNKNKGAKPVIHKKNFTGSRKAISKMIITASININKYAEELFQGDFSIFPILEKELKKKAEEISISKWC